MLLQAEARYGQVSCHGQALLRAGGKIGIARDEMPFAGLQLRSVPDVAAQPGVA